ncbi:hypothetical protein PN36_23510 [Candidatus Thiomargarita nelsonii]|uniref:DUF5666 domain-containing protein n=1 Tax=Candidatus Thiomargarita nelsonii TaxID=1003181 RepID=A0A0A6PK30_9GAMM|nr:hypothetical protein PN36_23510 [Candidatus Thiomargarita nelsonii]
MPFGLQDLRIGDRIEMNGFLDLATDTLIAENLVREEVNGQVALEGPVDNVDANVGTLTILGISVQTDTETVFEDERLSRFITAEQFFESVQNSELLVDVEGILMGNVILAESLEISEL